MNNQTFLQIQAIELRHLLEQAGDNPVRTPQLRIRLQDVEKELEEAQQDKSNLLPKENVDLPRAAIFLRGGGVQDSAGIRPSLAGEALIQYEKMFTEQAIHDEREAAKNAGRQRRPRGAPTPGLLFTGTPRGSFGLEFVPQATDDDSLLEVHARSLGNVANALVLVAGSDSRSLDQAIQQIPTRVLQPLKQFLKTLAQHGAELRLAFHDRPSQSLTSVQVQEAADRLEREMKQDELQVHGIFRGVARESGVFDLKTDAGEVITGTVADDFTEDDLERIHLLTNHPCTAKLQKTTVSRISGTPTATYVLLDAR